MEHTSISSHFWLPQLQDHHTQHDEALHCLQDGSAEGPDSIPKFGTMGGIDAKTGAPPASIHETSISDISGGAKQNFPQDPISQGIGSTGAGHASHGAASFGGTYLVCHHVLRMFRIGGTACLSVHSKACNTSTQPSSTCIMLLTLQRRTGIAYI